MLNVMQESNLKIGVIRASFSEVQPLRFLGHQLSSVIEYAVFIHGLAQQWRLREKRNMAQTLNACIAQRKHAISHLTMENHRNIIECCNNSHQGAPRTGKQTCTCASNIGDASHVTCFLIR